jgi:hypothetical protein
VDLLLLLHSEINSSRHGNSTVLSLSLSPKQLCNELNSLSLSIFECFVEFIDHIKLSTKDEKQKRERES